MKPKYSFYKMERRRNSNRNLPIEQRDNSREGQLRAVAHQLGMRYSALEGYSSRPFLSEFNLFKMGRNKMITNVLKKRDDAFDTKLQIFDYQFETGYGGARRTYRQSVFFVQSKKLALPEFNMEPESIFHKISNYLIGSEDIDFEGNPRFSGNYVLTGDDEDYIRFMMNPHLLQFFSLSTGWYMEGINFYLILYKLNTRFKASSIKSFYDQGHSIYQSMSQEMDWKPIL